MGKRSKGHQQSLWVATQDLPRSAGHPFYEALNAELRTAGFDEFVEERCRKFYAEGHGRPSLAPAIYFRMLLVGYFEGIDSERGIAWRCSDSLALRSFLGLELSQAPPDHSTLSRTRRLIDVETHAEVFAFVLQLLSEHGLVRGQTIGVDATTLEANAAMRSLVRRDTGQSYQGFLEDLAESSGVETPTKADLARIDRKRPKKGSNDDWVNPSDPEAQVTKMKDGRTHLAHKAEHAVDLDSGAILGVAIHPGAAGDTATVQDTIFEALLNLVGLKQEGRCEERPTRECVADKGYHSNETLIAHRECGDADLHQRTATGAPQVEGQGGGEARGLRQPASDEGRARPAALQAAQRAERTLLCALPGHRRNAARALARPREHREALLAADGGVQPRALDAAEDRVWDAPGAERGAPPRPRGVPALRPPHAAPTRARDRSRPRTSPRNSNPLQHDPVLLRRGFHHGLLGLGRPDDTDTGGGCASRSR